MKPGYKTTEFWLSLLATLVGAVMASGLLSVTRSPIDDQVVGIIATVLGALGYTVSRTFVKRSDAAAGALTEAAKSQPENPT